ncbi:(2Fe-2S) ferredoxin domain-containing protein [Flexilinea flocculi]|nr:NAD(P)H-dependent oxidoreductase subunit E [Flexilinea flocculi]NMB94013.1 (2Fe-2S) ferredoxin domain-containing protein [Flexilinea flocculi]
MSRFLKKIKNEEICPMIIVVCIGSSCHLKGAQRVVEKLQQLVLENHLEEKVILNGSFCMGNCTKGVCVQIGETTYSVSPESVETFFQNEVLHAVRQ